jgi:hypothetical protein
MEVAVARQSKISVILFFVAILFSRHFAKNNSEKLIILLQIPYVLKNISQK